MRKFLLDIATEIAHSEGLSKVTRDRIAEIAKVPTGTVSNTWKMPELLDALWNERRFTRKKL